MAVSPLFKDTVVMVMIDNYEVAFSRMSDDPDAPEVVLLVLEEEDVPHLPSPSHASFYCNALGQCAIDIHFQGAAKSPAPHPAPSEPLISCVNVPVNLVDALMKFSKVFLCTVNEDKVVSEHHIPFRVDPSVEAFASFSEDGSSQDGSTQS